MTKIPEQFFDPSLLIDLQSSSRHLGGVRVLISGQSEFSAEAIRSFVDRGHEVVMFVCTNKDPSVDAGERMAARFGVPTLRASTLSNGFADSLRGIKVDLGVMAYVTLRAHEAFLSLPTYGTIQYHPSLLPRYKGPSSINWAIINGEETIGFSIFVPDEELDGGGILHQSIIEVYENETAGGVYRRALLPQGVKALVDCAESVVLKGLRPTAQDSRLGTYYGWCLRRNSRLEWERTALDLHNLVRGCDPRPGAWFAHNGEELTVCASRALEVDECEPKNKPGFVESIDESGAKVVCGTGLLNLLEVRGEDGTRVPFREAAQRLGICAGTLLQ